MRRTNDAPYPVSSGFRRHLRLMPMMTALQPYLVRAPSRLPSWTLLMRSRHLHDRRVLSSTLVYPRDRSVSIVQALLQSWRTANSDQFALWVVSKTASFPQRQTSYLRRKYAPLFTAVKSAALQLPIQVVCSRPVQAMKVSCTTLPRLGRTTGLSEGLLIASCRRVSYMHHRLIMPP